MKILTPFTPSLIASTLITVALILFSPLLSVACSKLGQAATIRDTAAKSCVTTTNQLAALDKQLAESGAQNNVTVLLKLQSKRAKLIKKNRGLCNQFKREQAKVDRISQSCAQANNKNKKVYTLRKPKAYFSLTQPRALNAESAADVRAAVESLATVGDVTLFGDLRKLSTTLLTVLYSDQSGNSKRLFLFPNGIIIVSDLNNNAEKMFLLESSSNLLIPVPGPESIQRILVSYSMANAKFKETGRAGYFTYVDLGSNGLLFFNNGPEWFYSPAKDKNYWYGVMSKSIWRAHFMSSISSQMDFNLWQSNHYFMNYVLPSY